MTDHRGPELTDAELESQLCTWAGRLAAATAEFLRLLAEFDRREAWAGPGIRSCAHWLSWRCGMGLQAARDHVRVARRLQPLPVTADAFAAGRLSYTKVRAICRVATPATERDLVEVALCSTAAQVERVTRTLPTIAPDSVPGGAAPDQQPAQSRLHWQTDPETGRTRLFGWLEAEDAGLVLSVLRAAADERARLETADAPGTPRTDSSRTAVAGSFASVVVVDAFVAAAQGLEEIAAAAAADGAAVHPPPVQVEVHVDADLLTRMRAEADRDLSRCHVQEGSAVPLAVVERLACDGGVRLTTHGSDGRTLDVGRRRRRPSSRQAQALVRRDRGCAVPGCGRTRFLHAHHVVFWSRGGPTALDNLVLLCGDHHRALHDGVFAIDALGRQRFRFRDSGGTAIAYAPTTRGDARELAADVSAYSAIDGATLTPDWYGDRLTRFGLDVIADTYVSNGAAETDADPWSRAA
jgi:hypothetical protein